ncbi:MAG: 2-dehydropantoate 2-reductase [Leptospirales bacterium]|jgi:2-dehydropantoate 2-reductase
MSLRIAVIGAGALGLYYGALLAKHEGATKARVALLARGDHDALKTRGIKVRSTDGDFAVPAADLNIYDAARPETLAEDFGPVDLILIGLKTTANAEAYPKLVAPIFNERRTVILCLQNGPGNEAALAELFPTRRILGGTAFLCSNRIAPGEIEHTEHALIHIAPYAKAFEAPRRELEPGAIRALFAASGIDCQLRPNYVEMRWRKQIWNVPFNALCTIHDCPTDRLLAMPGMPDRIAAAMREIIQLGDRVNAALGENNANQPPADRINCGEYSLAAKADDIIREQLEKTRTMDAYKPSMLIDYRAGRPIEYDAIIAACLRERDRHAPDFEIPVIERIARDLKRAVQAGPSTVS